MSLKKHRVVVWLKQVAPEAKVAAARNISVLGLMYAVKSGVGIGPLPTAIADEDPDLVRVLGPIPKLARSWRLRCHPSLRRTPRVAAFFDFIVEEREALKSILTDHSYASQRSSACAPGFSASASVRRHTRRPFAHLIARADGIFLGWCACRVLDEFKIDHRSFTDSR